MYGDGVKVLMVVSDVRSNVIERVGAVIHILMLKKVKGFCFAFPLLYNIFFSLLQKKKKNAFLTCNLIFKRVCTRKDMYALEEHSPL